MEPVEMQEFSNQMKEAGESKEGGESLTKISLAISVLAVLVALVTVLGHRSHTDAVLSQARAADQWNEYQAKKIRSDQIAVAMDLLTLQPSSDSVAVQQKLNDYRGREDKWKDDLRDSQEKALDFEKEVRHAEAQAGRFDLGEALLQISVVLCSITLFTRRRLYFITGLTIGAIGLLCAAAAFLVR